MKTTLVLFTSLVAAAALAEVNDDVISWENNELALHAHEKNYTYKLDKDAYKFVKEVTKWTRKTVGKDNAENLEVKKEVHFNLNVKNQDISSKEKPCGDLILHRIFKAIRVILDDPAAATYTVELARSLTWHPSSHCLHKHNFDLIDGGAGAGFEMTCGDSVLVAAAGGGAGFMKTGYDESDDLFIGGSTINVKMLDGELEVAGGVTGPWSAGLTKYVVPDDTKAFVKTLHHTIKDCAANNTLVIHGGGGGGWKERYMNDHSFHSDVVAYGFGFTVDVEAPERETPAPLPVSSTPVPTMTVPSPTSAPEVPAPAPVPTAEAPETVSSPSTDAPTPAPTPVLSTDAPTAVPTPTAPVSSTDAPTPAPTPVPSTDAPTAVPTPTAPVSSTDAPTPAPTPVPSTDAPTAVPTSAAPVSSTDAPTPVPAPVPSTDAPTAVPTPEASPSTDAPIPALTPAAPVSVSPSTDAPAPVPAVSVTAPATPEATTESPSTAAPAEAEEETRELVDGADSSREFYHDAPESLKNASREVRDSFMDASSTCRNTHTACVAPRLFNDVSSKSYMPQLSLNTMLTEEKKEGHSSIVSFVSMGCMIGIAVAFVVNTAKRRQGYVHLPMSESS